MADEQVIIDIKVTSEEISEANRKINQLTESIEELSNQTSQARKQNAEFKKQQQELTAQYEQNKISTEKYLSEVDKLNTKILANNKIIAENTVHLNQQKNERNANIKLVDSETGAYNKLSTLLNKLRNSYKDLVVTKQHDTAEGKAMLLQIQQLDAELKQVDETVGQNQRKVGSYEQANKSLKAELRELKQELYNLAEGTVEYNQKLQRAVEIQEMFDDTQERIKGTMTGLEDVMSNVSIVGQGIAGAFEAAQGAAVLFGDESEDVQKAMLKIQASIALANGLQGLEGMGKALKNLATQMTSFGPVQKTITTLQYAWNAAVKANPIGAAVAAIAALVGVIYGLSKAFSEDTEEIRRNNTASDGLVLGSEELKQAHEEHIRIMKGLDIEYDVITGKISDFQAQIMQLDIEYKKVLSNIQDETKKNLEDAGGFFEDFWASAFSRPVVENGEITSTYEKKKQERDLKIRKDGIQKQVDAILEQNKKIRNLQAAEDKRKSDEAKRVAEEQERIDEQNYKKALDRKKKADEEYNKYLEELGKNTETESSSDQQALDEILVTDMINQEQLKRLENAIYVMDEQERLDIEAKARQLEREEELSKATAAIKEQLFDESESFLQDIAQMKQDEKLEKLKANSEAEADILKNQLDKGLISEEEYNQRSLELTKKTKLEEAKLNKKNALWEIAISTAVGIAKAIPNVILMAFAAAQGALQSIFVAARPLPTFGGGVNDIVSIGGSHASGNDVDVWGFSGGKKQFFGKVERGEAMPVIRKSAVNDYQIAKLNGKFSPNNKTFANGTPDITNNAQQIDANKLIDSMMTAFSNVNIVAKIEDITKEAGRKMEIVNNSKV